MELSPKQSEIASCRTRFRVVNAGRRFGKTILSVEEMIGVAVSGVDKRIAYIAPTFQQARDIAWEHLKRRAQPLIIDTNESQLKLTLRTTGGGTSVIQLKSWDAVEALRGQKFDFVVLDEVAMMRNFWIGWQEVIRPALTDTKGAALFISTPKGFNHFFDLFKLENTEKNFKSFHATSYDNPHLDKEELEEARRQITEDRFAQEYLADFRKQEGLVYKEFNRDTHLFDDKTERKQTIETIAAVDFGYTNPTAILKIERDSDQNYFVSWEWYKRQKTTAEIVEVTRTIKSNVCYPDPAEPDRIQEMENAGINCREVSKDIVAGIQTVRDLFKQGRLFIHKDCVNLINELETYHYPESTPDKNEKELPEKSNDHAVDALRYALHMNAQFVTTDDEELIGIY